MQKIHRIHRTTDTVSHVKDITTEFDMDHLTRPFGTELSEEDEILYVSSNDYHGIPFLEYVQTNKAYQVATDRLDANLISLYGSKLEISELECFLQTWLFFALLQELLGENFHQDDFVCATPSKVVISTKTLPGKLQQWMNDPNQNQERLRHLTQCLQMAMVALDATPIVFDTRLKIGIAATAEVIGTALLLAANARGISRELLFESPGLLPMAWGDFDEPGLRAKRMQTQNGWCPAQASLTLQSFYSLQAKIYISRITKPCQNRAHAACTLEGCLALQIDPLTYKSLHRCSGICGDVKANQADVVRALKNDKNALLDLRLNETSNQVSVAVEAAEPNSWYVALSHVWADGLGNTKENSLPQCQLRHLYDLLTRFCLEKATERDQQRPYLWLDTLCCPVDPGNKLRALAKMPEVYRQASQVLVLDSSLTEIDCGHFQAVEVMTRVFSCGWIFRLWTLNEANLASKIWVQFRDGSVELGQVLRLMSVMTEPETYHLTGELCTGYGKLQIEPSKQGGGNLWYLTEALRYRSLSDISDEPICVAALLRLDVAVITGEEKLLLSASHEDRLRVRDERMARLWEASAQGSPKIPKSLIYHVGDRLTRPGLRWAPSTLLNIQNTSLFFCPPATDLAVPSINGLTLGSAAFSISVPERVDGILGRPSPAASSMVDLVKYDDHHWLTIFSTSAQKRYPSGCDHLALYDIIVEAGKGAEFEILTQFPIKSSQEPIGSMNCLLVKRTTNENKPSGSSMRNVQFSRQGLITNHDQIICNLLNSIQRSAQALQDDSITQEVRESSQYGDQDPRYRDALKRLLKTVESTVNQLEAELDTAGTHLPDGGLGLQHERRKSVFALLSRFYRNRYLVKKREFPASQEYCLG